MGPMAKPRKVAGSTESSIEQIAKIARPGTQLSMLKSCGSSLVSAASGKRRWALFCDLAGRRRFPPAEEGVLAGPSFLGAGRSFKIHVARLEKKLACCPALPRCGSQKRSAPRVMGWRKRATARTPHTGHPHGPGDLAGYDQRMA